MWLEVANKWKNNLHHSTKKISFATDYNIFALKKLRVKLVNRCCVLPNQIHHHIYIYLKTRHTFIWNTYIHIFETRIWKKMHALIEHEQIWTKQSDKTATVDVGYLVDFIISH